MSDEPRLGYSRDGNLPFKKIIELGEDTKLARVDPTTFKLSVPERLAGGHVREKVMMFRCNDAK